MTKKYLPGASKKLIGVVRDAQPFMQKDTWLRELHDLDIANKHKNISPVIGNAAFTNVEATQAGTGGTMKLSGLKLNSAKIGQQCFASIHKSMRFTFAPTVNESFYFAATADQAAKDIHVEHAYGFMRSTVFQIIKNLEELFPQ